MSGRSRILRAVLAVSLTSWVVAFVYCQYTGLRLHFTFLIADLFLALLMVGYLFSRVADRSMDLVFDATRRSAVETLEAAARSAFMGDFKGALQTLDCLDAMALCFECEQSASSRSF